VLEEARPLIFVCQHGSNLSAAINPIEEIAQVCLRLGIAFIVDASQTAGHLSICLDDLAQKGLSAWVCSGHKGLLGPAGSGLVYLAEGFSPQPLVMGGTGSGDQAIDFSQLRRPCDYEAGTIALPAIAGLAAAIAHIDASFEEDSRHINALSDFMIGALLQIEGLRILGPLPVSENASSGDASSVSSLSQRLPLVSLVLDGVSSSELAFLLDSQFGIAARAELHCTPLTHRHLNTYPDGALRLSWNAHTTHEDLQTAVAAIKHIAKMRA
jgi:selenocysteine lyase/cysteine desulfurase